MFCKSKFCQSIFAKVEIYCFSSSSVYSSSSYPFASLRPIRMHDGERLIGVHYFPRPFFVGLGSLGSRSIIGFPPRKTPRFNEYYVHTRYPAHGVYCARHESSLPIIPASSHGVVMVVTSLDCRLSNQKVCHNLFKCYNVFRTRWRTSLQNSLPLGQLLH